MTLPIGHTVRRLTVTALLLMASNRHPSADISACGELQHRLELTGKQWSSLELNTLLFAASDKGCDALLGRLLALGAVANARDRFGEMPLAHAAKAGHGSLVATLLGQGAAIDARNLAGSTALNIARTMIGSRW
jgi:ankyrin repeat protein